MIRLNKGEKGKKYRVVGVREGEPCLSCTPCLRLRLLEFGLLIGEEIEVKIDRDPMVIRVGGSWDMGIRSDEAVRVEIEEI
jgi:Fe2+ transport system protein FeoA